MRRALVAGAVGTLAMDAVWYRRYRNEGGTSSFIDWEFRGPAATFTEAGAPAQVGQKLAAALGVELPNSAARLTNNVVHWGTGLGWGFAHSVVHAVAPMVAMVSGPATGAGAFATSYVVLPRLGVYKSLSEYDGETLWKDLSAHLVFGATVGVASVVLKAVPGTRKLRRRNT